MAENKWGGARKNSGRKRKNGDGSARKVCSYYLSYAEKIMLDKMLEAARANKTDYSVGDAMRETAGEFVKKEAPVQTDQEDEHPDKNCPACGTFQGLSWDESISKYICDGCGKEFADDDV